MRHWRLATGAALGAALGLFLGLTSWPIDPGRVRRDLSASLGPIGAPVSATLTLLPRPTLRLRNVSVRVGDGALTAKAAEAAATLRFDRLFAGVFEPLALTLSDADIRVDLEAARLALKGLAHPRVSRLIVDGGSLETVSASPALSTRVELASAQIDWPSSGSALRLAASGRWRSQPVEASAQFGAPLAAAHGEPSPVSAALDSPLAQLRVSGDWSPHGRPDGALYRGKTSALIPSLDRFARWLGLPPPGPAPAGLELSAKFSADTSQLKLSDAELKLGGQPFEGDLAILRSAHGMSISGTLAADALDLEALIGPPPTLIDASGGWSRAPALPQPIHGLDLDLRLSASRAVWRGHAIENAAADVSQRDGHLGVKLLDADFAHGSLSGEIGIEDKQGTCASTIALSLDNADIGGLLSQFGEQNFSGHGGLKISVRARGRSPADIVMTADGEGSLEVADGALRRVNFEEALRRGQRRLIDVARDMNAGSTRFSAAHGHVQISDGEARILDTSTEAPGVSLAVTGAIDLAGRAWRARVAARQSSDDGKPTPDGARLDFGLYGPWTGPVLAPLLAPAD